MFRVGFKSLSSFGDTLMLFMLVLRDFLVWVARFVRFTQLVRENVGLAIPFALHWF